MINTRIHSQTFGKKHDTAVLLVMGATESMNGWPDRFCEDLASENLFVIRYDHRDTGQSVTQPFGEPGYSVEDLANDIFLVLDRYEVSKAHLVGMSLGGLLSQMAAIENPERVESLTLIGSEPLGWDGPDLPHISNEFLAHFSTMESVDWENPKEVELFKLKIDKLCCGPKYEFDEIKSLEKIREDSRRSTDIKSSFNHGLLKTTKDWSGSYKNITKPVLVIHGEKDSILPLENGQAIATNVLNSRLLILEGVGHELPTAEIRAITAEISNFVALI